MFVALIESGQFDRSLITERPSSCADDAVPYVLRITLGTFVNFGHRGGIDLDRVRETMFKIAGINEPVEEIEPSDSAPTDTRLVVWYRPPPGATGIEDTPEARARRRAEIPRGFRSKL